MRTQHHLRKSTLTDFAAGRLCEALSLVAASHVAWCRECRRAVAAAAKERDGSPGASRTALTAAPAGPGQTALEAMDRLPAAAAITANDISDFGLPMPLALRLDGRGLRDLAWRKVLPGVAVCGLALPSPASGHLRLVRMAPGRALPLHSHDSRELSLVLRGAYRDRDGRYTIGDIADLDGAALHRLMAEDTGECICLVAAETPPRYSSWLGRLWQRLRGL